MFWTRYILSYKMFLEAGHFFYVISYNCIFWVNGIIFITKSMFMSLLN